MPGVRDRWIIGWRAGTCRQGWGKKDDRSGSGASRHGVPSEALRARLSAVATPYRDEEDSTMKNGFRIVDIDAHVNPSYNTTGQVPRSRRPVARR